MTDLQAFSEMLAPGRGERPAFQESSRTRQAAIAIEINRVDSAGSATKKRGIVVRSASERILSNQKLVELTRKMNQVNPKQKESASIGSSDLFEIYYISGRGPDIMDCYSR